MGELTYDQLGDRLAKGRLGGNYFLHGEDSFLRDEAISLLSEAHLAGGSADFDLDQVSGDDADPGALASTLATPPMVSAYRVIAIRDAQGLSPGGRSVVERAVGERVAGRVLIIAADPPRGSKAKFYDVLRGNCTSVALRTPSASELPGWVAKRARSVYGIELEMPAAQLLAAGIGGRLGVLAQELEKLVTPVEPGGRIGVAEVRDCVGALPQVDRWEWIDKVCERRFGEAASDLPALLDSGESAVWLIGSIGEALVRVGLAREGEAVLVEALKRERTFGNLKWKIQTYVRQARGWTEEGVATALAEMLRADRLIKSGGLADRVAIEEALLRMGTAENDGAQRRLGGGRG